MQQRASSLPSVLLTGALSGAVAGVVLTAYLVATSGHATTTVVVWSFLVALGWGIGYAYLAARTPQIVARPLVSGITFGAFVMLVTWVIEVGGAMWTVPTTLDALRQLVGYTVFYGLPLAYITSYRFKAT